MQHAGALKQKHAPTGASRKTQYTHADASSRPAARFRRQMMREA
eukprot:CAMPEP_0115876402 /NCGR_PEP_ID=MMETSP0287-20121206/25649_1 /TAXON_ID=412157 /ORGANISM="Chrysochromulina rotalis, Strain UIO044" /LENGTH=43 /DNA_ID= /DNA_START= /DNA_END= /DNA_ORIENTATION=